MKRINWPDSPALSIALAVFAIAAVLIASYYGEKLKARIWAHEIQHRMEETQ